MHTAKSFKELLAEYERQNEELDRVMGELKTLAESGVQLVIPQEFFEAFDAATDVRPRDALHLSAVRA